MGAAARFDANLEAIRTVKQLSAEGRQATPEEQRTIAKFSGFGDSAFEPAFRYRSYRPSDEEKAWERRGSTLKALLTTEEYRSIETSRINAFYTTPEVVRTTWDILRKLGVDDLKHPRILEPSAGSGRFLGYQPQELAARSSRIAVELDTLTGQMLKQTYPETETYIMGYEQAPIPKDSIDVAISNVPFGNIPVFDRDFRKGRKLLTKSIHNYFFAKALDHLRPGGVLAFVTSHHTLDAPGAKAIREYLADRADLLAAVRLPKTAFPDTEVVTDIVFMRKREPEDPPGDRSWVDSGRIAIKNRYGRDVPVHINRYYFDHPEMIMGTHSVSGTQYGKDEYAVEPDTSRPLARQLGDAETRMPSTTILRDAPVRDAESRTRRLLTPANVKEGAHYIGNDGKVYVNEHGESTVAILSPENDKRLRAMLSIRDAARKALRTQLDNQSPEDILAARNALNTVYDGFVTTYGALNAKPNADLMTTDPDGPFLRSLEVWKPKDEEHAKPYRRGKVLEAGEVDKFKMPVFTKPVIHGLVVRGAEDETDALALSLNETGRIDFGYMAKALGRDADEIRNTLARSRQIFRNPVGDWEPADQYLSGEIREKLRIAEAAATANRAYNANVEALQAVQPEDLPPSQISVRIGTTWIPGEDYDDFIRETLGADQRRYGRYKREEGYFRYIPETGEWVWAVTPNRIDGDAAKMTTQYGTRRISADKILFKMLNGQMIEVSDKDEDGKPQRNIQETAAAQEKAVALQEAFRKWVWSDSERATRLAGIYNERFNSSRPRRFDGSHQMLTGMAKGWTRKIHSHQKDAIWRVVQDRTALLAHEVGFGKSLVMVGSGMELKRLGLANKVLYVVPKATHEQFAREFLDYYPHSNVLVPDDNDFSPENRPEFISRAVTGDWDAIVLSDTQFRRIPLKPETEAKFLREQLDSFIAALIAEAQASEGRETKSHKELQKDIERLEKKLQEAQARVGDVTDQTTYLEDMGIDQVYVDEADNFKNLQFATKMGRIKGLPASKSDRAWDMYQKTQYLQGLGKDHGVVFATGTPVANTIAEMYTMMRYLQGDMLHDKQMQHFDAWAKTFGETTESIEQTVTGDYRLTQRFAKFMNAPELSQIWQQVADIRVADEVPEMVKQRPRLIDEKGRARRTVVACPPDEHLLAYMQKLAKRADELPYTDKREDNMLKISNDARKASLDMRMVESDSPANPNGKVPVAARKVAEIYHETTPDKGTQLVFLDLGTPKASDKADVEAPNGDAEQISEEYEETKEEQEVLRNVYKVIKENLIAAGVPENEIAFIHDAKTKDQRQSMSDKMNTGKVRVLVGSTGKMGVGLNVQKRAAALHHLDAPWRPRDIEQREGRIIRQGNQVYGPVKDEEDRIIGPGKGIRIFTYVTERSFDAYMWQAVEAKSKAIKAIMRRENPPRVIEDIDSFTMSAAEAKAVASGNPNVLKAVTLKNELNRLQMLEASHTDALVRARSQLASLPKMIGQMKEDVTKLEQDAAVAKAAPEKFTMTIEGQAFAERPAAGEKLADLVKSKAGDSPETAPILAQYKGFTIRAHDQGPSVGYKLLVTNPTTGYAHATGSILYGDLTPAGLLQRIDNRIKSITVALDTAQRHLEQHERNLKTYQEQAAKPFEHADRLAKAAQQLAAVETKLKNNDMSADDLSPATSFDDLPDEEPEPVYRFGARAEEQRARPEPAPAEPTEEAEVLPAVPKPAYRPPPSKEEVMARIWAGATAPPPDKPKPPPEPPKPTMPQPGEQTMTDLLAKIYGTKAVDAETVKAEEPKAAETPRIGTEELTGAHHGQKDLRIRAYVGDKVVGRIEYVEFDDALHIDIIEVAPEYRRQGIATALLEAVKAENPGMKIHGGLLTEEGAAFVRREPKPTPVTTPEPVTELAAEEPEPVSRTAEPELAPEVPAPTPEKPEPTPERPTWPDGRLIPQKGDEVYQVVRGPFGTPASIRGVVNAKGRIEVTGSASLLGAAGPRIGKTYQLDDSWTVKGDPEIERRQTERKAKVDAEQAAWEERDRQMHQRTRDAVARAIAEGHKPLDPETVKVGDLIVSHFDGETRREIVTDVEPDGFIGARPEDIPTQAGGFIRASDYTVPPEAPQGGQVVSRRRHEPEIAGSTPAPATKEPEEPWRMTKAEYLDHMTALRRANGEDTDSKDAKALNLWHRIEVRSALRNSRPVPAEVLKDYPDLKPVAPEPEPAKPAEEAPHKAAEPTPTRQPRREVWQPKPSTGLKLKGRRLVADPENLPAARRFVANLRLMADTADEEAATVTEAKGRKLQQNARAARRDADRIEKTIQAAEAPKAERKAKPPRKAPKPPEAKPKAKRLLKSELVQTQQERTPRAQAMDRRREHSVVVPVTSPRTRTWVRHPGRMDVKGIDTPAVSRKAPQLSEPSPRMSRRSPRISSPTPRISKRAPRLKR